MHLRTTAGGGRARLSRRGSLGSPAHARLLGRCKIRHPSTRAVIQRDYLPLSGAVGR